MVGRLTVDQLVGRSIRPRRKFYKYDLIHYKVNIIAPIVQRLGFIASNDEARVRLPVGAIVAFFFLPFFFCNQATRCGSHFSHVAALGCGDFFFLLVSEPITCPE